ncbi:MAG: ubiquinone biosynthesis methyltransferase UbiE [Verrucomicrobia bacterium]|nr:MAG: ubiquinone biosynthesis methyltransferase UbiE [Verrucomicrobiota bacterium]
MAAMNPPSYDDAFVQALFDRMGGTYDLVNLVSSVGFAAVWRRQCVRNLSIDRGARVCDMMSGTGECWPYLLRAGARSITSVDFSRTMIARQALRRARATADIASLCENATTTSIPDSSMDYIVSAFGLKTLSRQAMTELAREIRRILKPGGRFSLIEISFPTDWLFYRMLGAYTTAFGSCDRIAPLFRDIGLEVSVKGHFYDCATSLVGYKAG